LRGYERLGMTKIITAGCIDRSSFRQAAETAALR
jgi:hypothetical protein